MSESPSNRESDQILSVLSIVLRRRKILLISSLIAVLAPVVYYNQTTTPVYEATASVVFEEMRGPVPEEVRPDFSTEQTLFNRIEEINSRAFAEELARSLPATSLAQFDMPPKIPPGFVRMRHISQLLDEGINAFPQRNSNIVRIRVQLANPYLCVLVADSCLSVLKSRLGRVRNQHMTDLLSFIESQLALRETELDLSARNLKDFKEQRAITTLDSDSREMLRKLTDAEVLHNEASAERASAQGRLSVVRRELTEQRRDLNSAVTSATSASTQTLRAKFQELETQRVGLVMQKYPPDHPEMIRLREEIAGTRKALEEEAAKLAKVKDIGDPLARIGRLLEESNSLEIELVGLGARVTALSNTIESYKQWLNALPETEMELARLEREREVKHRTYMTLLEQRKDVAISLAKQIPGSRVIDTPLLPMKPIKPRKALNLGMGAVLGLIVGFGLGFLLESRSTGLGSILDFQRETGWSVLASVPVVRGGPVRWRWLRDGSPRRSRSRSRRDVALIAVRDPEAAAGEAYHLLRTQLEFAGLGTKYRSLLVTSCGAQDGKSSTLSNLAATFGAAGWSTVVVDAELRRPTLHSIFGVDRAPGLTDLLFQGDDAIRDEPSRKRPHSATVTPKILKAQSDRIVLKESVVRGVSVLTSGDVVRGSRTGIPRPAMKEVLEELKLTHQVVLVDSAPAGFVHDAVLLCGLVDAVVVVVDARSYNVERLVETKLMLERAGAKVVGAVLNRADLNSRYASGYRRYRTAHAS